MKKVEKRIAELELGIKRYLQQVGGVTGGKWHEFCREIQSEEKEKAYTYSASCVYNRCGCYIFTASSVSLIYQESSPEIASTSAAFCEAVITTWSRRTFAR